MSPGPSRARWCRWAIPAGVAGAAVVLYAVAPDHNRFFPPCPVHELTGWHCPGCGSLRAIHRLLHGDFAGAVRLNVLMVASLPLIGWLMLADLRRRTPATRPWAIWTYFAIVVIYGVLRNIPWAPLQVLAPH